MRLLRWLAGGGAVALARLAGAGLLLLLLALRVADPLPMEVLRNQGFDLYQRLKPREPAPAPVVIVDIDEESLARYGQWPWPRTRIAELIERLAAAGAIVTGFDIVFAEPDRLSPARVAKDNPQLPPEAASALSALPDNETVMAEAMLKARVIVGETASRAGDPVGARGDIPQVPNATIGEDPEPFLLSYPSLVQNIGPLSQAAAGRGVFTVEPDADGVYRRMPLVMRTAGALRLALAPEILRIATGGQAFAIRTDAAGISGIVVGGVLIPTDPNGKIWPWFSHEQPARYVSAGALLSGEADLSRVSGRMAIVGTSAVGLEDYRATPVDPAMPGVEIHAQILENILSATLLNRPNYALGMELVFVAIAGALVIALAPLAGALRTAAGAVTLISIYCGGSWWAFAQHRLLVDATFPVFALSALFVLMATASFLREEAQRRQIRGAFAQYLSPALVDQLSDQPGRLQLGGETRELSVLFTDVRGFTTISESYKQNPQGLTRLMNRFLNELSRPILAEDGTIDKYMGDAIMAFWNAPLDAPDHAMRAARAALAMIAAVDRLNAKRREELAGSADEIFHELNVGIGINTGLCVVGNMGSDLRFDYTALGDTVNLASRLEGQSKPYGIKIILGDNTAKAIREETALLEVDLIRVKGKKEPERIHALMGDASLAASDDFVALRAMNLAMLSAYRSQDWISAETALGQIEPLASRLGIDLEEYLFIYETRINEFRSNPPGREWDGVYTATEK
jgi:adenylate cyclase